MPLPKCPMCNSKQSRFIKEQEDSGLFIQLGIRISSSKILLLCDSLF